MQVNQNRIQESSATAQDAFEAAAAPQIADVSTYALIEHGSEMDTRICFAIGDLEREQLEETALQADVDFDRYTTSDELRSLVIEAAREQRGIKIYDEEGGVLTIGFHDPSQPLPMFSPRQIGESKMKSRYVQLVNGNVVPLDELGFIKVIVSVEISDLITNDLEKVNDLLSNAATGADTLSDISISVVGHHGNTLQVQVTGQIDLEHVIEVSLDDLPLVEFEVQIARISYGSRTVRLLARTEQEAIDIADDDAGNHTYSEQNSDYVIEAQRT